MAMQLQQGKLFLLKNIVSPGTEELGGYGQLFLYTNNLTFVSTMGNKANQLFSIPLQHITSALAGSEAGLNGFLEVRATLPGGKSRLLKFSEGLSGIAMFSLISQTSPVFTQWADAINSARAELRTREENRQAVQQLPHKTKIGRNEKCPCGSGKRYKYCCGKLP